jgi:hypothetical protein
MLFTVSPPEAKDIRGMSCFAMMCPVSILVNDKLQLLMVKLTLTALCSIRGLSAMALNTFLSTCS